MKEKKQVKFDTASVNIRNLEGGISISFHVQPGAKKSEMVGVHGEALKVRIHAPPVDGKANAELIRFLSDIFSHPAKDISILRGEQGREKVIFIRGMTRDDLEKLLLNS